MSNSRLRKLASYLRPYWQKMLVGIFTLLLVNALGVYIRGSLIKDSIDELRIAFSLEQVWQLVFLLLSLASLMWFLRMTSRILVFGIGRQVEFDLKQKIFQHLLTLEPSYFSTMTSGDLINRATSDVDSIRRLLGFAILSLANTTFAYGLTLPAMLAINVEMTLLAIAVYPLMLVAVQLFSNQLRNLQRDVQENLSDLSELIQEDMSGIALIKIYAQEINEQLAFRGKNERLLAASLKLARTRNLLFPLIEGLSYVSLLVLLWRGSIAIAGGLITIGDFVALILLVESLVFPTALLGFTITAYQRGEVSVDRVEAILDVQPQIYDDQEAISLGKVIGQLQARHLSYTYPGSDTLALKNISFTIEPGETIAVVGPIGSGKSTLANILPHLLEVEPGQVFLDGQDITKIKLRELRQAIAYVPQDSFLFSTTIQNNIRYGSPRTDQPEIEVAAKQSQIHPEILTFPQQYDTVVGERGITLSGGQRQRTSLARALLVDAPVLILDDALSSVDNQTATDILHSLAVGVQRKTVIFITHQLSAAAIADRIFVMNKGEIVQIGTHQVLVKKSGLYQSLWNQYQLEKVLH